MFKRVVCKVFRTDLNEYDNIFIADLFLNALLRENHNF